MQDLLAFNCLTWLFVNEKPVVSYPIEDITVSRAWMVHIPALFLWRWAHSIPISFLSDAGCIREHGKQEHGGVKRVKALLFMKYPCWFQISTNVLP